MVVIMTIKIYQHEWSYLSSVIQLIYYDAELGEFKRNWMGKQEENRISPDRLRASYCIY